MAWDPLNASMDLFGELKELARREREVEQAYLYMAETCEEFAVELLGVRDGFFCGVPVNLSVYAK